MGPFQAALGGFLPSSTPSAVGHRSGVLVTVPVVALTMNLSVAGSVLVGACAGLLYVRLLARSVARLSDQSRGLGRFQLIVPTLLVVGSAKLPQLDLLPAFLGFLLYKPALILQHVFDDR